jgi:hypothetical protein
LFDPASGRWLSSQIDVAIATICMVSKRRNA